MEIVLFVFLLLMTMLPIFLTFHFYRVAVKSAILSESTINEKFIDLKDFENFPFRLNTNNWKNYVCFYLAELFIFISYISCMAILYSSNDILDNVYYWILIIYMIVMIVLVQALVIFLIRRFNKKVKKFQVYDLKTATAKFINFKKTYEINKLLNKAISFHIDSKSLKNWNSTIHTCMARYYSKIKKVKRNNNLTQEQKDEKILVYFIDYLKLTNQIFKLRIFHKFLLKTLESNKNWIKRDHDYLAHIIIHNFIYYSCQAPSK